MKKTKLPTKIFGITITVLFAIFLTIFISNKYGYYEYRTRKQVVLTEEQIKRFESDIKEGKNVTAEDYLTDTNINYQTKFSKLGLNISNILAGTVKKGVDIIFNYLGKFVVEN